MKYKRTLQKRRQRKAAIKEIKKHSASILVICFVLAAIGMTTVAITGKMQAAEPVKTICEHDWYMDECHLPTCETDGYFHSTCLKCGMEKSNIQSALKHDTVSHEIGTTEDGETIVYVKCTRCGEENTFYN